MSQTVAALRSQQPQLPAIRRYMARLQVVSANTWLSGIIAILAILPSVVLTLQPVAGAYSSIISLAGLLAIALKDDKIRKLALPATILPLTLMVMAIYPYHPNSFYRTFVAYDVMLLLAVVYSYLLREKRSKKHQLKLKQVPQILPLMIIIGELLGVAGYGILRHQYGFQGVSLPLVATAVIPFVLAEELLFRNLIQQQAMKLTNKLFALILTVAMYASLSIGTGSLSPTVFAVLSAAVLSTIYSRKQNVALTITANAAMKLAYIGLMATFIL